MSVTFNLFLLFLIKKFYQIADEEMSLENLCHIHLNHNQELALIYMLKN